MSPLVVELLVATFLVTVTTVAHLTGLEVLLRLTGLHLKFLKTAWLHVDRLLVPMGIALGLFVLHGLEIWAYAITYRLLGALPSFEDALFFSSSAYSTLGAPGAALPKDWRIVGVLEAVNGLLLIGWSTAFLFQTLRRIMEPDSAHPLPEGAIAHDQPASTDSDSRSPRASGSGSGSPVATNSSETELMQ